MNYNHQTVNHNEKFVDPTSGAHPQTMESLARLQDAECGTNRSFKLFPSKTAAYRNSVLLALPRLLAGRNAELLYTGAFLKYILLSPTIIIVPLFLFLFIPLT